MRPHMYVTDSALCVKIMYSAHKDFSVHVKMGKASKKGDA